MTNSVTSSPLRYNLEAILKGLPSSLHFTLYIVERVFTLIICNLLQETKAYSPIDVTESPNVMNDKFPQLSKVLSSIVTTEFGMTIDSKE